MQTKFTFSFEDLSSHNTPKKVQFLFTEDIHSHPNYIPNTQQEWVLEDAAYKTPDALNKINTTVGLSSQT